MICETDRLTIRHLTPSDGQFLLTLFNEESFIRYIGDKQVRTLEDAANHIKAGPIASYHSNGFGMYLVQLKGSETAIGICGLLKREQFDHPDLGFAFLPEHCGKGFALEASSAVLNAELKQPTFKKILAITLPDNMPSNQLLGRLGFVKEGVVTFNHCQNNLYAYLCHKND